MNYATANNPLYRFYAACKRYAKKRKSPIANCWEHWRDFAKWCEEQGYDENVKLHYSSFNPFAPGYVHPKTSEDYPLEFIAYDAHDPYELILTSAPSVPELSEKLHKLGYPYDAVMAVVPIVIVYLFAQKTFIANLTK